MLNTQSWELTHLSETDGSNVGSIFLTSTAKTKNGTLLFGGKEGLLMVSPEQYQQWDYQPPLKITSIKIDNRLIRRLPAPLVHNKTGHPYILQISNYIGSPNLTRCK